MNDTTLNIEKEKDLTYFKMVCNSSTFSAWSISLFRPASSVSRDLKAKSSSSTRFNDSKRYSLEQLKANKRKLRVIKGLRKGWNGYNGEVIAESLISMVENLLSDLDYQPRVFPTGRGTLQIESYLDNNNFLEIEISLEDAYLYQLKNGVELEKEIDISEINDIINDLYS